MSHKTSLSPGLDIALDEAGQGRFVVPGALFAKTPHPDVSSWSQWATCNPREIRRNWPEGGANVIVACKPSGLLVVDLDVHGDITVSGRGAPFAGRPQPCQRPC